MSSKFDNFHTHFDFDDCFPVSGNFDQHVASDYSTSKRAQHIQHSKMPALLRLDSVGEVSSARLPSDSQIYNSRANTKPVLRNSKSVDSSYTNRFLTNSSMASAKSLTRSPSKFHGDGQQMSAPSFTKAHSFAQELQPQLADTSFCGVKSPSSSFMFGHQSSDLNNVFSMFASAKNYSKLYSSRSNQISPVVDTTFLASMDNYIGRGQDGRTASILSTVAAALNIASIQPSCSWTAPTGAQSFIGSNRKDGVLNITKSSEFPFKDLNNQTDEVSNITKSSELPGKEINKQQDEISNITKLSDLPAKDLNNQSDEISNITKSSELACTEVKNAHDDISNFNKPSQLQSTKVKHKDSMKNVETLDVVAPSTDTSKAESDLSVIFDDNFVDEVCFPIVDSSLNNDLMQWSLDDSKPSGKRSRNSASKSSNDKNSCLVDSLHNSLKSMVSLALSAPRKAVKKGRPSSKKKRKRQREKRKQESSPCVFTGFSCSSNNTSNSKEEEQALGSPSTSVCQLVGSDISMSSPETSNSILISTIPRESSPVKPQSKCSISNLFFMSDLDETEDDDDSDESYEWSDDEDVYTYNSPIKCSTFNVALNLDMIFKRKSIPSLKSVLGADESESDSETSSSTQSALDKQNVSLCTSNDDSFEDKSVGVCVPLAAAAALAPFGLTMGLSLDSLFTKKPSLCSSAKAKVTDSTFDVVDGLSTSDDHPHVSNNVESDPEVMGQINAKWNENYPSAGFRSCQDTSANEITDSNIKVHFAAGAELKTVHIIEAEDRAGKWHLCSLDQERFQRKILDLEKVVSPVLEANHRAKVLKQNQFWENSIVPNNM